VQSKSRNWGLRVLGKVVPVEGLGMARPARASVTTVAVNRTVLIDSLLGSEDPAVRWRLMVRVLGEDPVSRRSKAVQQEVKDSPRVRSCSSG
jgi:hypothetical protein